MPENDVVKLSLPATSAYARIARVGAASLANRWAFSQRKVQDLRLAVDEAVILLIRYGGPESHIALEYRINGAEMTVVAEASSPDGGFEPLDEEALERFRRQAGELLASYEVDAADRTVRMTLQRD